MNPLDKITRARASLINAQPFYGCLALHLQPSERPDLTDTMATDGVHLFWNAAFVDELTEAQLMGVVAHEVTHCALAHHARIGARDLETFNRAADFAINPGLVAAGLTLAPGMLLNPAFANLSAEEIYSILSRAKPQQKPQQGGQGGQGQPQAQSGQPGQQGGQAGAPTPGNGQPIGGQPGNGQPQAGNGPPAAGGQPSASGQQGAPQGGQPQGAGNGQPGPATGQGGQPSGQGGQSSGGQGQPGNGQASGRGVHGMGGIIPAASVADAADEIDRWQVITRQAVNVAKAHNAGTVPGYLKDLVGELNTPRADFRELLAAFIDSRVSFDYSFARPNRRFIHAGYYLPGAIVDGLEHVVFAVDTSGSITADMINAAASEIAGAMEAGKIQRLTVLMADTRVCSVSEFTKGDDVDLKPAGGGGTDFRDTFRWIADNAAEASAVVYLTDLEVSQFGEEPACPVLWATHGDSRRFEGLAAEVPFGEAVYIGRL